MSEAQGQPSMEQSGVFEPRQQNSATKPRQQSGTLSQQNEPPVGYAALGAYSDLLTVEDVAEVLHVSTRTIYRFVEEDELPYLRVGHRLYFPKQRLAQKLCLEVA